jgi:hypothetical protein
MHANDVIKYGHSFLERALDGLDESHYEDEGVCGFWSVKDIIGHLTFFEGLLVEILNGVLDIDAPTPFMQGVMENGMGAMNDLEYEKRKDTPFAEVMEEYNTYRAQVADLIEQVPLETQRQAGLLAWYGSEYDLQDFLVYTFYGHKREHGAQINVLKDRLESGE